MRHQLNQPNNPDHKATLDDILKMCKAMLTITPDKAVNPDNMPENIPTKTVQTGVITAEEIIAKMKQHSTK